MTSRKILGAVIVMSAVAGSACGSDGGTTTPVQSTTYTSTLNAANERPLPTISSATGSATYVLTGNTLTFTVTVNGLTGPATNSHIHVGSSAVAGPVIVGFVTAAVQNGNVTSGTIDLTQPIGATGISGDSLKTLLNNGNAYTNVHTAANGGGEIRGQIVKQ
jgi:hypothetical protein